MGRSKQFLLGFNIFNHKKGIRLTLIIKDFYLFCNNRFCLYLSPVFHVKFAVFIRIDSPVVVFYVSCVPGDPEWPQPDLDHLSVHANVPPVIGW